MSLCIKQGSKRNDDSVSVEELDWSAERQVLIPAFFQNPTIFFTEESRLYRFSEMTSLVTFEASLDCREKGSLLAESRLKTVEKYSF